MKKVKEEKLYFGIPIKFNDEVTLYQPTLKDIIYSECPKSLIIFANTRDKVDEIYKKMKEKFGGFIEIHYLCTRNKK